MSRYLPTAIAAFGVGLGMSMQFRHHDWSPLGIVAVALTNLNAAVLGWVLAGFRRRGFPPR